MTNSDVINKQLQLIDRINNLHKKRKKEKENSTSYK